MFVLYDSDCGFCRWSAAKVVRRSPELIAVAIQSEDGQRMLSALSPEKRLASAHTVGFGGVRSRGDAVIDVLGELPRAAFIYKLARAMPAITNVVYGLVAGRRRQLGKLVPASSRHQADEYLRSASGLPSGPGSAPSP